MIRLVLFAVSLLLVTPSMSWGGVHGTYYLNTNHLKKQVKRRWVKEIFPKVPAKHKALIKNRLKQVLKSLDKVETTMWLKQGGKFRGVATVPNKKKVKTVSLGTWSRKGSRIVEIKSQNTRTKRKTVMLCILSGTNLSCQGRGSGMKLLFVKGKRPKRLKRKLKRKVKKLKRKAK